MTWNEFKNSVEERLTDEEKNLPISYIEIDRYDNLEDITVHNELSEIAIY